MSATVIFEQILVGLLVGSQYALISVGLALLYGVMRITNVAHGDLVTLGGYIALTISVFLIPSPVLAVPLTMLVVFAVGMLLDKLFLGTLRHQGRMVNEAVIVLTLGLSIVLSNSILAVWGPDYTRTDALVPGMTQFLGLRIGNQRLLAGGVAVALLVTLSVFLEKTKLGLAIRAVSQNPVTARVLGINTERIFTVTFGIAAALAGTAGPLIAPDYFLFPSMGFSYTVKGIVIIVMGGMGNILGALVGSIVLGVAESLAVLLLASQYRDAIGLLVMVLVLLIRPAGLLGRETA